MARDDSYYLHISDEQKKTVTVKAKRSGSMMSDDITAATKMGINRARQLFGSVGLEGDEVTWVIPNALLSNVTTIRTGDSIIEGDETFIVKSVIRNGSESQWICLCRAAV